MRVALNTGTGIVQRSPVDPAPLDEIVVTLGDSSLNVFIVGESIQGTHLTPGVFSFAAKKKIADAFAPDFAGTTIVSGQVGIEALDDTLPQILNCAEDWKALALAALFDNNEKSARLFGQYRWASGGVAVGTNSQFVPILVNNSAFDVTFSPAPPASNIDRVNLRLVTSYVGGGPGALDQTLIASYPSGSLFDAVVNGVLSTWRKVPGTDVTNLALGVIRTADYDAILMPYVLVRVAGI